MVRLCVSELPRGADWLQHLLLASLRLARLSSKLPLGGALSIRELREKPQAGTCFAIMHAPYMSHGTTIPNTNFYSLWWQDRAGKGRELFT